MFNNKMSVFVYAGVVAMTTPAEAKTKYLGPDLSHTVEKAGSGKNLQSAAAPEPRKIHH